MKDKIETGLLLDYYGGMLTVRQQEILHAYCDNDLSLAEISDEYGITRQAAQEIISRSIRKLYHYEEKLGLTKKIHRIILLSETIIKNTEDMDIKNSLNNLLSEIKEI